VVKNEWTKGFDAGVAIMLLEIQDYMDLRPEQESVLLPLLDHLRQEEPIRVSPSEES